MRCDQQAKARIKLCFSCVRSLLLFRILNTNFTVLLLYESDMTDFSIFNQPPMSVTQETLTILSTAFPESLGTCVVFRPPAYFRVFWNAISRFIDPKTASKVYLLSGDISTGSENDMLMKKLIGNDWRIMTGAGGPILATPYSPKAKKRIDASPGFDIATYWPAVLHKERAWMKKKEAQREKTASKDCPVTSKDRTLSPHSEVAIKAMPKEDEDQQPSQNIDSSQLRQVWLSLGGALGMLVLVIAIYWSAI